MSTETQEALRALLDRLDALHAEMLTKADAHEAEERKKLAGDLDQEEAETSREYGEAIDAFGDALMEHAATLFRAARAALAAPERNTTTTEALRALLDEVRPVVYAATDGHGSDLLDRLDAARAALAAPAPEVVPVEWRESAERGHLYATLPEGHLHLFQEAGPRRRWRLNMHRRFATEAEAKRAAEAAARGAK